MKKFMYPGTFDPLTLGHLDIIKRASRLCDELVVAVATNSSKTPLLSAEERIKLIEEAIEDVGVTNATVVRFSGLLADYMEKNDIHSMVRGLRDTVDFTSEMPRAYMSQFLYENFETIYLLTNLNHSFISSSAIKELIYFNGSIEGLVPENVRRYIIDNHIGRVQNENNGLTTGN